MVRYFIEQKPDRFYDPSELEAAKARARRLSKEIDTGVYVIAEESDGAGHYEPIGSVVFYAGRQDALEGCFA